jgi:hypothetical protein
MALASWIVFQEPVAVVWFTAVLAVAALLNLAAGWFFRVWERLQLDSRIPIHFD